VIPDSRRAGETPLEFARDLHDETGCAVAIIVTDCYWDSMRHGRQADVLEQWVGRISHRVIVPPKTVFRQEVEQMIRLYGGIEPTARIYKMCAAVAKSNEGRLRTLCEDLRQAACVAKEDGVPMQAQHLEVARTLREKGGSWGEVEVA
jgi:DNA transposition AAA+ family ATPase